MRKRMGNRTGDPPAQVDSPEFRNAEAASTGGVDTLPTQDTQAPNTGGVSPPPARLGGIAPKKGQSKPRSD